MTRAAAVCAHRDGVFIAIDLASDRHVSKLTLFGRWREEMRSQFLQRLALILAGPFVDVHVVEIPAAEGFKHALAFGALHELGNGQAVQRSFSVMTLGDEDGLQPVARHAGRK